MTAHSRLHKSLLNAKVGLIFYFLTLVLSFFSRKIFLDTLGASFIGLSGTLQNILGFLNLAELGVGACISFFLYKPLQEENKGRIKEVMSVFGYMYRKIGLFIGMGGLIVGLFFPLIFRHTDFNLGIIYFTFLTYLASSLIGYFINYRQILLSADQKNYVVTAYFQTAGIIKTIVQIVLAYYYKNLYVWVSVEFLFSVICCIILNWKINKEYPWLKTNIKNGKALMKQYPEIITNTKQIFVHKIKDFLLNKSDEIMIFAFVSLKMVAFYGNYTMIINKLAVLFNTALDGVSAGVGNLVAEGNKSNMMKVFWELMAVRYFIGGLMVFSLYYLINPFIVWWLGSEYLLSNSILILLMVNLFIMQTRGVVDIFNHSHGLYADTWSAWVEGIINLTVTISIAIHWGIIGILMGKIVSLLLIVLWWKPYYLFTQGLKVPVKNYWKGVVRYYLSFAIAFIAMSVVIPVMPVHPSEGLLQLLLFAVCTVLPFVVIYFILLYVMAFGTKDVLKRVPVVNRFIK